MAKIKQITVPQSSGSTTVSIGADAVNIDFKKGDGTLVDLQSTITDINSKIATIPAAYKLPIASATTLGGIMVGSGLTIDAATGKLSAAITSVSGNAGSATKLNPGSKINTVLYTGAADITITANPTSNYTTKKTEIDNVAVKTAIYNVEQIDIGTGNTYNRVIALGDHVKTPGGYSTQLAFPYTGGQPHNPQMRASTSSAWSAWKKLAFTDDISSYAPAKAGTGATGTWGISISGNAATASKLGHKITFSGGATGSFDGSADLAVAIPTGGSVNLQDIFGKIVRFSSLKQIQSVTITTGSINIAAQTELYINGVSQMLHFQHELPLPFSFDSPLTTTITSNVLHVSAKYPRLVIDNSYSDIMLLEYINDIDSSKHFKLEFEGFHCYHSGDTYIVQQNVSSGSGGSVSTSSIPSSGFYTVLANSGNSLYYNPAIKTSNASASTSVFAIFNASGSTEEISFHTSGKAQFKGRVSAPTFQGDSLNLGTSNEVRATGSGVWNSGGGDAVIGVGLRGVQDSLVCGYYNEYYGINGLSTAYQYPFMVGIGTSTSRRNGFGVDYYGRCGGRGTWVTGADYAEYFEWQDGNPDKEDRVGHFVTLVGKHIQYANSQTADIIGVISAAPAVVGDTAGFEWQDRFKKDVFGRQIKEYVSQPDYCDMETGAYRNGRTVEQSVLNPDYDENQLYVPREQRPEWSPVGLLGKLVVIDDGTCQVDGYCWSNDDGIATKADKGYRVMQRLDETHIKILVR